MSIERKFKLALDEVRLLMLGSQILVGFQLRGAFQEGFDRLPSLSKWLDVAATLLIVSALALLVAPSSQHRLVERGEITTRIRGVVNGFADVALLPFALALGLDLYVVIARAFGAPVGFAMAGGATILALAFWYVLAFWYRGYLDRRGEKTESDMRGTDASLQGKIEQMLTEARIALPGVQALLGFQLAVIFTRAFERLPDSSKLVHGIAIGCIAVTLILLIAPAAFHRITFGGEESERFFCLGSALITIALLPMAIGISGDIFVMIAKIARSDLAGAAAGGFVLLMLIGFWYVQPLILRSRQPRAPARVR